MHSLLTRLAIVVSELAPHSQHISNLFQHKLYRKDWASLSLSEPRILMALYTLRSGSWLAVTTENMELYR